jgi:hypothetical protein
MVVSTLSTVPGHTFHICGIVAAEGQSEGVAVKGLPDAVNRIANQAGQLGGNAVIDVKVTRTGEHTYAVTGTAVMLRPADGRS